MAASASVANSSREAKEQRERAGDVMARADRGGRQLGSDSDMFQHNAWDNAAWTENMQAEAEEVVRRQSANPLAERRLEELMRSPAENWDRFYKFHETSFFKDRHWLKIEFPEVFAESEPNGKEFIIYEVGCGVGNSVWPMIEANKNPNLYIYASDFSQKAVELVRSNPRYDETKCKAFVWDLTSPTLPEEVAPGSCDIIMLVFAVSAIHSKYYSTVAENLYKLLKPGGRVVLRDYGRYDITQLRFRDRAYLDENFYARGDDTLVYFFTNEDIVTHFGTKFRIEQNTTDRRILVNRKNRKTMYRVFVQAKLVKPAPEEKTGAVLV